MGLFHSLLICLLLGPHVAEAMHAHSGALVARRSLERHVGASALAAMRCAPLTPSCGHIMNKDTEVFFGDTDLR